MDMKILDKSGLFFARFVLFVLFVSACAGWGWHAHASLPDAEKALLTSTSMSEIAVSGDGRLLVGATRTNPMAIWFFDTWLSRAPDSEDELTLELSGCASPDALYVAELSDGMYRVLIPCADSEDGKVYRVDIEETTSLDTFVTLEAAEVDPVQAVDEIEASDFDPSTNTLYLAGKLATGGSELVSMDAESESVSAISTTLESLSRIAWLSDIGFILGVTSSGEIYLASSAASQYGSTGYVCGDPTTSPRALLPVNSTQTVLIGEGETPFYIISRSGEVITGCGGYDWGVSEPASITLLEEDGAQVATNTLYIRGESSGVAGLAAYDVDLLSNPGAIEAPDDFIATALEESVSSADRVVAGSVGRLFLSGSAGVSLSSAAPYLTIELDKEPIDIGDGVEDALPVTLTSDEDAPYVWVSLDEPGTASVEEGFELVAGESSEIEIDITDLGLSETSPYTIYIYAEDASSNLGWTAFRVDNIMTPDALTVIRVGFSDGGLHLIFEPPSDDAVDEYQLLISDRSFTAPADTESLPMEWREDEDEGSPTPDSLIESCSDAEDGRTTLDWGGADGSSYAFCAGGVEYPVGGSWPMSIGAPSDEDATMWTEDDEGHLDYIIYPLDNGTTYFVSIRAVISGTPGAWSDVVSGAPEETCGLICPSDTVDGVAGFCSCNLTPLEGSPRRIPHLTVLALGALFFLRKRRRY